MPDAAGRSAQRAAIGARLSAIASLKSRLFGLVERSDGAVLTSDSVFKAEVDELVGEVHRLQAARAARTLPVWLEPRSAALRALQSPPPAQPAPNPPRRVPHGDGFLERLESAEQRDAAAAGDAMTTSELEVPTPRRSSWALAQWVAHSARGVTGRLSRAPSALSARLSRRRSGSQGAHTTTPKASAPSDASWWSGSWRSEPPSEDGTPATPIDGRLGWTERMREQSEERVSRQANQLMRQVVFDEPRRLSAPAEPPAAKHAATMAAVEPRVARSNGERAPPALPPTRTTPRATLSVRRLSGRLRGSSAKPATKQPRWSVGKARRPKMAAMQPTTAVAPNPPPVPSRHKKRRGSDPGPHTNGATATIGVAPVAGKANQQPVARTKVRRASADPLSEFGLATRGPIAAGAFSMVVRAAGNEGAEVAVKTFNKAKCAKDPQLAMTSARELRVLRMLGCAAHDHLANLLDVHESASSVHLVLEYCAGGSLQRHLQAIARKGREACVPEAQAAEWARQLCSALAFLHERSICHRDVKPSNVLFSTTAATNGTARSLKLCDFGFAIHSRDGRCSTMCGTPTYMAPELHASTTGRTYLGAAVDCWALGALIYEMIHCKPAFTGNSLADLVARIRHATHEPFASGVGSPAARALVSALLEVKPKARCTAAEAMLSHAGWLQPTRGDAAPEMIF
jgi:tRNA A-37 threonylcarbamoyl transferase component Bud32